MKENGLLEETCDVNWSDLENLEANGGTSPHGLTFKAFWFGTAVDIKEVRLGKETREEGSALLEFQKLKEIRHTNIVQFIGICKKEDRVFTVTEHLAPDLYTVLHDPASDLPWHRRIRIAIDATLALTYLHMKGIVHRDFRSKNLLMATNGRVKVSHVGLARRERGLAGDCHLEALAPEVHMGERHDPAADIFGLGVILFELITRRNAPPRSIGTKFGFDMEAFAKELNEEPGCPPTLRDLAIQCVATNANNRPKAKTILALLKEIKLETRHEQRKEKKGQQVVRQRPNGAEQSGEPSEEDGEGSGNSSCGRTTPVGSARLKAARSDSAGVLTWSPLQSARSASSSSAGSSSSCHWDSSRNGREGGRTASERNVRRTTGEHWSSLGARGGSTDAALGVSASLAAAANGGTGFGANSETSGDTVTDCDETEGIGGEAGRDEEAAVGAQERQRTWKAAGVSLTGSHRQRSTANGGRRKPAMNLEEQLMCDVFGDRPQRRNRREVKIFAEEEEALGSIFASNIGRSPSRQSAPVKRETEAQQRKRKEPADHDKCRLM